MPAVPKGGSNEGAVLCEILRLQSGPSLRGFEPVSVDGTRSRCGAIRAVLQQIPLTQHTPSAPYYGPSLCFGPAPIGAGVVVYLLSA
jgi:hypothetical protein